MTSISSPHPMLGPHVSHVEWVIRLLSQFDAFVASASSAATQADLLGSAERRGSPVRDSDARNMDRLGVEWDGMVLLVVGLVLEES